MLFNSLDFGIFLPVVAILYWTVFNRHGVRLHIFMENRNALFPHHLVPILRWRHTQHILHIPAEM